MAFKRKSASDGGKKPEFKTLGVILFPQASLNYIHLAQPDTEGEYADDKFKVTATWPLSESVEVTFKPEKEGVSEFGLSRMSGVAYDDLVEQLGTKVFGGADFTGGLTVNDVDKKNSKGEPHALAGTQTIAPKTKIQPFVADAAGDQLDLETVKLGRGTIARVSAEVFTSAGKENYVALRLRSVKVLKAMAGTASYRDDFGDEDEGEVPAPSKPARRPPRQSKAVDLDDDIPF